MFSSSFNFAAVTLGLASVGIAFATPAPAPVNEFATDGGIIVTHKAADYFPQAVGDLSPWDISTRFTGYNSTMESWLTSLDPHSGATAEDKAQTLISVAFAKPFDHNNKDMASDVQALLDTVAGKTPSTAVDKRDSTFTVSTSHIVLWHTCAAFFACVSGTACSFSLQPGSAPRSQCQSQGGQNCCISWSTYSVQAGFFSTTWTTCNQEVNDDGDSSASCEGKSTTQGGDVCLSNRASGCT
ncbi:hypothetical protein C8F04DRAFT_1118758 [Mycena alexandri]|uniref:WD-like domain-containing protein n=1 Tax=Mycena alexandri TaxID=1745969 RepID=A0AAD6SJZ6_9AGAR|nr:hypothetical protein C8F04DRAFT_1118757 [Mycena alexandri]KAJ7028639.1 hypothetical protein C8F04DRAFT_1118758 [Mycena alexandri]